MTETPGNGTGQLHVHGIQGSFPANQTWKATWRPSLMGHAYIYNNVETCMRIIVNNAKPGQHEESSSL